MLWKNVSVQFSEEQLKPLNINCVSKRFFPSVPLMSDYGPVKQHKWRLSFCVGKSFKVQYPFTSVIRFQNGGRSDRSGESGVETRHRGLAARSFCVYIW